MASITIEMSRKALAALAIMSILGQIFSDLLKFGENSFQATIVLSFYLYSFFALFGYSQHRLFHVLSIPIFTQFLHLFQKYDFTAGANSIWRLFPFVLLVTYFIFFFLRTNVSLTKGEKLFLLTWITSQCFFLTISPNLPQIISGGFLLYLLVLPLYFLYLHNAMQAPDFNAKLEAYLCLLYLILGLGTFGLVIAGAAYKESDNLLATRNISDTNVTMAYFILLWPFALLYSRPSRLPTIFLLALLSIFIAVVILSFSRGAVFIITPYLIISILAISRRKQIGWFCIIVAILSLYFKEVVAGFQNQDLGYFWALRFGNSNSAQSLLQKIQTGSGRAEIHAIAYALFQKKPLFGHGTGSFEILGPGYREAHSLLYTLLAEQGLAGTVLLYSIFAGLATSLFRVAGIDKSAWLLIFSLLFYLIFNHTVGSVFVIIPAKSVTINCIAPILLLCIYFYGRGLNMQDNSPGND